MTSTTLKPPPSMISESYLQQLEHMSLKDWLESCQDPRRSILLRIYEHYRDLLHTVPASSSNHQVWRGGLADHLSAMCRFAWHDHELFKVIGEIPIPYTFENVLMGIFCHDAEKFVVYGPKDDPRCAPFLALAKNAAGKEEKEQIKWDVLAYWRSEFGLELTEDETNAVKYTHGEGSDYSPNQRIMSPLAAAVGNADRASARIFFNYGQGLG